VAAQFDEEDLILLITSGATGPYKLDPIRIMKSAFIVSQRGAKEWKSLFNFKPYDYGPFDPAVYRTLESLSAKNLIEELKDVGRYPYYRLTEAGSKRVEELTADHKLELKWLKGVGQYVTAKSFERLLKEIYAEFPAFAEKSVFKLA